MQIEIFDSKEALGQAAAREVAELLIATIAKEGNASIILATGNSQIEFLRALGDEPRIAWDKVVVFQMDEYLGITSKHSASFRRFHQERVVDVVHPQVFYGIEGDAPDVEAELARYTALLEKHQPIACVMGIGENGHLAFNDPPADFETTKTVHVVTLDEACRRQQVGEGHFPTMDAVPTQALSLTVSALLKPPHVWVLVPEQRKAHAVKAALEGPVTPNCPASILQTQPHVRVFLDRDSASLLV